MTRMTKKQKFIQTRVPVDTYAVLVRQAAEDGISMADYVRRLLKVATKSERSLARRVRAIELTLCDRGWRPEGAVQPEPGEHS